MDPITAFIFVAGGFALGIAFDEALLALSSEHIIRRMSAFVSLVTGVAGAALILVGFSTT